MSPPDDTQTHRLPIAIVYWGRLGAGASLMSVIAQAMDRDGRFRVLASPSRQSELPSPLPAAQLIAIDTFAGLVSLALAMVRLPFTLSWLIRRLKAERVQAIVTVMPHLWGLGLQIMASRAGIKTILIVHDAVSHPGEKRAVFDWLVRREARRADRVVTLSNGVADQVQARGDASGRRLVRLFHPTFPFGQGLQRESTSGSPFRLLFFGRILPYKGVPLLLEAFATLRMAGVACQLRIVGRGEIDAPAALCAQQGLTIETGWVAPEAIAAVLRDADAIVLPYIEASQSGVVAAAYGAGLPVVVTPVGGLIEQVRDGETGVIAHAATPDDLAAAIRRLVESTALYQSCRAGAVDMAAAQSPDRFAAALGDAIFGLVNPPHPS